jgi:TatD DNase family protein
MRQHAYWIDTHAHLADEALVDRIEQVLDRAYAARVLRVLCVAVDAKASAAAVAIAHAPRNAHAPSVWASVGIHPNYAQLEQPGDWDAILALTDDKRVCALGETGLDRYWDDCPFDVQKRNFAKHWTASRESGLPVIVHSRDCDADMLQSLQEESQRGPLKGIMHSFCSDCAVAQACIDWGLYISFSGMLTYKKNDLLRQVAASVPLDRVLIETDAPYLSPEPKRNVRPNEPSLVVHTGEVLAKAYGVTPETMASITTENALRLLTRMQ